MTATALTWRGLTATYTPEERAILRDLYTNGDPATRARECEVIHELKALFDGELSELEETGARLSPQLRADREAGSQRVLAPTSVTSGSESFPIPTAVQMELQTRSRR